MIKKYSFFKKGNELQDIGLDEITHFILSQYLTDIGVFVDELIDADPIRFTRDYFEIRSRIMLGFPSVLIFGETTCCLCGLLYWKSFGGL